MILNPPVPGGLHPQPFGRDQFPFVGRVSVVAIAAVRPGFFREDGPGSGRASHGMVQRSPLGRVVLRRHYVRPGFQVRLVVGRIPVAALLDPDHLTAQPVALNFVAGGMVNHNHVEVGLLVPTPPAPGAVQDDALGPGLGQDFPQTATAAGSGP